jgi:hypothetical protein
MRLRRKLNKTVLTRPRKGGAAKRRRQLEQKKRLIAFGVSESDAAKLNPREILTKLKYPKRLVAELAKG